MINLLYRAIYHPVINKMLLLILYPFRPILPKALRLPPSGRISLKIQGQNIAIHTNQTSYLTQLVFWNGYSNFEYTPIFIDLCKKIDSFWDIGANIGYYSLIASAVNPKMSIVAFEPAPEPLHYLRMNVHSNTNAIQIAPVALSDKAGQIDFYEIKNKKYTYLKYNLGGEGNEGSKTEGRNFSKTKVEATTADSYLRSYTGKVDLIKIDTEGTEHLILQNADHLIKRDQPIIICETLFDKIEAELEAVMLKHGYEFYNHIERGLQKTETLIRKTDNGVLNCFFVPPGKRFLIEPYLVK